MLTADPRVRATGMDHRVVCGCESELWSERGRAGSYESKVREMHRVRGHKLCSTYRPVGNPNSLAPFGDQSQYSLPLAIMASKA